MVGSFLFLCNGITVSQFYLMAFLLGCSTGYWAIFVTIAAEQFGTNLRATAATTIPNMVRGALPLINLLFLDFFQKTLYVIFIPPD